MPAAGSTTEILQHGQALYRGNDYRAALQCFNIVIASGDPSLFAALDNRAATYTKLGDLDSALRDGKRMIKVDKSNSVGYLRTSRILQLSKKNAVALRICDYGLRNVPNEDSNYGILEATHGTLLRKSNPADPVGALPMELVLNIMLYLDFKTVVKLLGVSRSWKSILTSCPELWRHLDFSYAGKTATVGTLFTYAKRANWAATRASFHINRESDIEVMGWIMGRCKALERLDIRTGPHFPGIASLTETSLGRAAGQLANLKTLVLSRECQILLNTVSQLIGCLASLERAEFHGLLCRGAAADWKGDMLKIRELAMSTVTDSTKTSGNKLNLAALLAKIPNVKDLTLEHWNWGGGHVVSLMDFTALTQLQRLTISQNFNVVFPLVPPSLQRLNFVYCNIQKGLTTRSHANLKSSTLPELTELGLARFAGLRHEQLLALLSASEGKVERLNLDGCVELGAKDIRSLIEAGHLSNVVRLMLQDCAVDDTTAELIATKLQHLKSIDLRSTKITGVGVKALVLKPHTKLERLVLTNCNAVSRDALDLVMAHGIRLDYGFPGGRDSKRRLPG